MRADVDVAQKVLRDLKSKISSQSKKNFVLEKDVRYLDSRIALLIQNRMALEEVRELRSSLYCPPMTVRLTVDTYSKTK
jgi:Ras GTPase-activating-like protein IQGAP2/3